MIIAKRPTPGHHRSGRRGMSLIELMVVMTGVAVMLGLCAVTIQALMRVNGDAQARLGASTTLARLASQFREDVHASDEMTHSPAAKSGDALATTGLRLTRGPRLVITYEASAGRVVRLESSGGKPVRRESYRIGKGNLVVFQGREEGPRRFVVMVLSRDIGKAELEPPRSLEILALLGRDRAAIEESKGGQPR